MNTKIDLTETRYDRLEGISWWRQDRLRNAYVLVAGAGALGNEILKNLALLGVGHILIADFDIVELTNLSRSVLFRSQDQQKPKAQVAAERLREINPDVDVLAITGDIRWDIGLGVYKRMDIALGGLDSLGARVALNEMCWKANIPWVDGGIDELSGIMRAFVPSENGVCFECGLSAQDYQQLNIRHSCQLLPLEGMIEGHIPTTPTIASVIAAWQVQEAVKWLHGLPIAAGQGVSYNGLIHNFFIVDYRRRESCLAHDTIESVLAIPDASSHTTLSELLCILRQRLAEEEVVIELDREIVCGMSCPTCGDRTSIVTPHFRLSYQESLCPQCGLERTLHLTHQLDGSEFFTDLPLSDLGIPPLHIMSARSRHGRTYFELTGDATNGPLGTFLKGEKNNANS